MIMIPLTIPRPGRRKYFGPLLRLVVHLTLSSLLLFSPFHIPPANFHQDDAVHPSSQTDAPQC